MADSDRRPTCLSDAEIADATASLADWSVRDEAIVKSFTLANFADAIEFVRHVAEIAESADHHPDIDIRCHTVHIKLTTHDCGGLSIRDFGLATQIDQIPRG